MGMHDIDTKVVLVDKVKEKEIIDKKDWDIIIKVNEDKSLIKYKRSVNLIEKLIDNKKNDDRLLKKVVGVPSSVAIAAVISAYARISINKFKNDKNNICIYSDTDSVVLQKKLEDKWVNDNLGSMKLEAVIKKGVFIAGRTGGVALRSKAPPPLQGAPSPTYVWGVLKNYITF
jgi:hypothetical protein